MIRQATLADIPSLVDLWVEFIDYHAKLENGLQRSDGAAAAWAEYIGTIIVDDRWFVFVAEADGVLVGYVAATVADYPPIFTVARYGFVQEIAVTAAHRRTGVARGLYEAAEGWLRGKGVDHIQVKVDVGNAPSRAFWASAGFGALTETLVKKLDA